MTIEDLLRRVVLALANADVPYMLTGSLASSLHSIPRATKDIDIIIFPNREQLTCLISLLPSTEYYAELDDALDALRRRGQFNVIDHATGWKVDFIIPPFEEFNVEEFERREVVDFNGLPLSVASAEDIIIAKLVWAKAGESMRQVEDVATVVRAQQSLNYSYIERWVRRLGLETQWQSARALAG